MGFHNSAGSGKVTESNLPQSVKDKLNEIQRLKETIDNLDPSLSGGDIDLGSFDK